MKKSTVGYLAACFASALVGVAGTAYYGGINTEKAVEKAAKEAADVAGGMRLYEVEVTPDFPFNIPSITIPDERGIETKFYILGDGAAISPNWSSPFLRKIFTQAGFPGSYYKLTEASGTYETKSLQLVRFDEKTHAAGGSSVHEDAGPKVTMLVDARTLRPLPQITGETPSWDVDYIILPTVEHAPQPTP